VRSAVLEYRSGCEVRAAQIIAEQRAEYRRPRLAEQEERAAMQSAWTSATSCPR